MEQGIDPQRNRPPLRRPPRPVRTAATGVCGGGSGTSGIAQMLLQSHSGRIHLLPALPGAWPSGRVTGLRARGGFEIDLTWSAGKLAQAVLRSKLGNPCKVRYGKKTVTVRTNAGAVYTLDGSLKAR